MKQGTALDDFSNTLNSINKDIYDKSQIVSIMLTVRDYSVSLRIFSKNFSFFDCP